MTDLKATTYKISEYYFFKLEELKKKADVLTLTSWEVAFLDDRWVAMEKWGREMYISEKQQDCIKNICRKQGAW